MAYSMDSISADCYPDTSVLINKFNIRDAQKLNEVESVISSTRYAQWLSAPQQETFDFSHYKKIHCYLFSDLYDWAGCVRTVDISKKGTAFTPATEIEKQAELIFRHLRERSFFRGLPHDAFVAEIVDFYGATNLLHPFREGNGRTQRVFLTQLIRSAGYDIRFEEMDTDLLMFATIQSAQGVDDFLKQVFNDNLLRP